MIQIKLVLLATLLFTFSGFSQGEEVGPLTGNPDLFGSKPGYTSIKANQGTFDSTFIYFPDTLSLPFFDEFSSNKFQKYEANYSDPGVTWDKKYRILDNSTLAPIPNSVFLTGQATFKRTYDLVTSTYVDEPFPSTPYKVGDLTTYPVVYTTTDLYPPYYIYDTVGQPDLPDTVWIVGPEYFQDSATQFFTSLNAPEFLWLDNFVYHNYRFAVEPRSLGVATFDGLDENGYPYAIGSTSTNYADFLTSKPLDLASVDASDSVYFSFLFQPQGFGDVPESSDSLVLEFYAKDLDQWFRVWSAEGTSTTEFQLGHIRIADVKYFKKGFQFRFKNYGALSGSLDHFHLDYVHLRALSGYQDTLFKDFAFVYPVGSLLKDYTSVPWDHFQANSSGKMNDAAVITVHNGSNLPENNMDGSIDVSYNSAAEGSFLLNAQTLSGGNINYGPRTTYTSYHDLSGGYVYDISKTGTQQQFDILATAGAQFPNFTQNDSTTGHQIFSNYYSHDDGSAEAAYGPTGVQARLAVKYVMYEEDSLIGLKMHFVPSVNDVSDKLFFITVWDDNAGEPGNVLYEDDFTTLRSPEYGTTRNEFITYYFTDTMKVKVGTTFYVGWRQIDAERLNIGLDRNLDHSDRTFYSLNGGVTWIPSQISGSVMIRPIVSTSMDAELGVEQREMSENITIFPNPTNGSITVETFDFEIEKIDLFNPQGSLVLTTQEKTFDISFMPPGVYFLHVNENQTRTYKVVKL